jgi:uncharacterized protein
MNAGGINVLNDASCRKLLSQGAIGRVGYVSESKPMIMPVDYVLVENMIVFRTDAGDKLTNVPLHHVCFEVDGRIPDDGFWSVLAQGFARDVTNALDAVYVHLRETTLASRARLHDPHWIAIEIDQISGRRLAEKTD